jgi:hypothetical protein
MGSSLFKSSIAAIYCVAGFYGCKSHVIHKGISTVTKTTRTRRYDREIFAA